MDRSRREAPVEAAEADAYAASAASGVLPGKEHSRAGPGAPSREGRGMDVPYVPDSACEPDMLHVPSVRVEEAPGGGGQARGSAAEAEAA
eukprot:13219269-Alexandrium_andersonii.AAC.1